ncbi:DMT family transporter [Rhizobium helianthi]|uniref:DMT family transporter n=1 Tax=Rhizobium helianthi TaxID=1132695 RepID=A0ABW4M1Y0_9HYPH
MNSKTVGYLYVLSAVVIFAGQDAFSKYLGAKYPPIMVTMIRFWAFAAFVLLLATSSGGIRKALVTKRPLLQVARGILLVTEIVVVIFAFTKAGLAVSQAILQSTPLIVTILSVPLLGEKVGMRRGAAIVVGLIGVMIILRPTDVRIEITLLIPLIAALMYAFYGIATRAVSRHDSAITSVVYAGLIGAGFISLIGPFYWTPIRMEDWPAMVALCIFGSVSHYLLIKAYRLLTAIEVQPITYLQLILSIIIATTYFGETVTTNMIVGSIIVVGAGLFTVWREHHLSKRIAGPDI